MNIGILILLCLSSIIGYTAWKNYSQSYTPSPKPIVFGEQVGRTRSIQSKTGDASMFTQNSRRMAIAGHRFKDTLGYPKKAIRETRTSSGSYSGAFETLILSLCCQKEPSSILPLPTLPDIIDGGDAFTSLYDYVLDGGDAYISEYNRDLHGGYAS